MHVKRVALYVRVSTEDQAREGYSLDAQVKRLSDYCKFKGWEIADVYRDEGYSGRNTFRPEYRRMMDEIDTWDGILVFKMDRIHRNSRNFALMMDQLRKHDREFNSVMEKFNSETAMGRFVMDIIQRIAQLESEQIGDRVKIGMARKAQTGDGNMGSPDPYGYTHADGRLIVREDEAENVREMFRLKAAGNGPSAIAEWLNRSNIPSKTGRTWSRQAVSHIISNPLYAGFVRWDGSISKGNHEAIVSPEDFASVNGGVHA